MQRAIAVESERDLRQDVGYGIRQLTDIAVRALSPSVNDPTTATTCVGYLQAILERLALAPRPRAVRRFEDQDVTIVMRTHGPAWYLEPLVQIARYADDARVVDALLRATQHVAQTAADGADGAASAEAARTAGERIAARALEHAPLDKQERASIERLRAQLLAAR